VVQKKLHKVILQPLAVELCSFQHNAQKSSFYTSQCKIYISWLNILW